MTNTTRPTPSSDRNWFQNAADWISDTTSDAFEWVGNGGYNWAIALPFGAMGFMLTQNLSSTWAGGGFWNSVIAFPLAVTGGMLAMVGGVRLFHGVADWLTDTVDENSTQPEPQRGVSRTREPVVVTDEPVVLPEAQLNMQKLHGVEVEAGEPEAMPHILPQTTAEQLAR